MLQVVLTLICLAFDTKCQRIFTYTLIDRHRAGLSCMLWDKQLMCTWSWSSHSSCARGAGPATVLEAVVPNETRDAGELIHVASDACDVVTAGYA